MSRTYSRDVKSYLLSVTDPDKFRVEVFYVKPYRGKERDFVREAILAAIDWLQAKALSLDAKIEKVNKRALWRVKKSAKEFLSEYSTY